MKHIELLTTRELVNRIRRLMSIFPRNEKAIGVYITEFRKRDDFDEKSREIENEVYEWR